jgi:hypothetical protein
MISCNRNYDIVVLNLWDQCYMIPWHMISNMTSKCDIGHDVTYDNIARSPSLIGHVRWQITWQSNGFKVSIPSCTGELGRKEEWSLAEGRSWLEPCSLGCPTGSFVFLASQRRLHMRSRWCELGSCLENSFSYLERLFSCAVCDEIMSVMKNIWCHKSLLKKQNGFHHDGLFFT